MHVLKNTADLHSFELQILLTKKMFKMFLVLAIKEYPSRLISYEDALLLRLCRLINCPR